MNENFSAYGIGKHKHKPEIEQYLSQVAEKDINALISFSAT